MPSSSSAPLSVPFVDGGRFRGFIVGHRGDVNLRPWRRSDVVATPESVTAALKATDFCVEWMSSILSHPSSQKQNKLNEAKHGKSVGRGKSESKRLDDPDFPRRHWYRGAIFSLEHPVASRLYLEAAAAKETAEEAERKI
jgi:hypothetical protein